MKKKFTSIKNKDYHKNKRTKKKLQLKGGSHMDNEEKREYGDKYLLKMPSIWDLLQEEGVLINDIVKLKSNTYRDIGGSSQDEVIKFILAQPEIMQEVGRKSTPAKYRIEYRKNRVELTLVLDIINQKTVELPDYSGMNLSQRLAVVVDLMSHEGDTICKFAKLMMDILRIQENLIELSKIKTVLEEKGKGSKKPSLQVPKIVLPSSNIQDTLKLPIEGRPKFGARKGFHQGQFYSGKSSRKMDYIGTNYELVPKLVDGDFQNRRFLLETMNPRDIFLIDFDYPCLDSNKDNRNKLSVYRSSGTSYSAEQKNLISPFCGKALQRIDTLAANQKKHYQDTVFRKILIFCGSILFPEVYQDKIKFLPSGKKGIVLSYQYSEWLRLFEESKVHYTWFIKFSNFFYYENAGQLYIQKTFAPYQEWSGKEQLYNFLGKQFIESGIDKRKMFKLGDCIQIKEYAKPLNIIEMKTPATPNKKTIESFKSIFYNRYFANEELFSLRNMGDFPYKNKEIRDSEMNQQIGDQNIFGINLYEKGLQEISNPTQVEKLNENINLKIMAYLYECFYYYDFEQHPISTISDLEEVLRLKGKFETIEFDVDTDENLYDCLNFSELERAILTLIEVGKEIGERHGEKYGGTIFYNTMKLPLVENINENP